MEDLTAVAQGLAPSTTASASSAAAGLAAALAPDAAASVPASGPADLRSVLEQHGIAPSVAKDASSLLQAVLDRMDDLAANPGSCGEPSDVLDPEKGTTASRAEPLHGLPSGSTIAAGAAPRAASRRRAVAAAACAAPLADPGVASCRAEAAQLCRRLSQLLDSSDAELRQVRHELHLARRAEDAVQKIGTAALEAALAAAEAGAEAASTRGRGSMPAMHAVCSAEPAAVDWLGLCHPAQATAAPALKDTAQQWDSTGASSGASAGPHASAVHSTQTTDPPAVPCAPASPNCQGAENKAASEEPSSSASHAFKEADPGGSQLVSGQAAEASLAGLPHLPAVPGGFQGRLRELHAPSEPCTQAERAPAAVGSALHLTGDVQQLGAQDGVAMPCPPDSLPAVQGAGGMGASAASHETLLDPPSISSSPGLTGSNRTSSCNGMTAAASQYSCDASSPVDASRERTAPSVHADELVDEPAGAGQQEGEQQICGRWQLAEVAVLSGPPMADAMDPAAAASPVQTSHAGTECQQEQGGAVVEPSADRQAGSPAGQAGEAGPCAAAGEALAGAERPAAEAEIRPLLDLPTPLEGKEAPVPGPAANQPPPRAPYNPVRADEHRAAAARRAEQAAGWRRLRERADVLALWHEYAAELGLDAAPAAATASNSAAAADDTAAQLHGRLPTQAPWCEERRAEAASPGLAVPVFQPRPLNGRLWQPDRAPSLAAIKAATQQATSLLPTSAGLGSSASTRDSVTRASSSCMATSSEGTSIGVAARHKVRALRYRLLRRQLAEAAGLDPSPAATTAASSPSLSTSSSGNEHSSSSSGACSPSLPPSTGAAEAAKPACIGLPPVVIRVPAVTRSGRRHQHCAAARCLGRLEQNRDMPSEWQLPATPSDVSVAWATDESRDNCAAAPQVGMASHLAEHSSHASPSSQASPAPASTAGPASSLVISSSCSSLNEIGSYWAGAAAGPGSSQLRLSVGRMEALQALKARTAGMRRTAGRVTA
ncbi:hypothetical protein ABPG77_002553 [Micractinium sp. CCAP 211/92]